MERTFLEEWNSKFGVKPPEWVVHFATEPQQHILEDIDREIGKREANIEELELELEQERFLLDRLCATKTKLQDHSSKSQENSVVNGVCVDVPKPQLDDSPNLQHISDTHQDTTDIEQQSTTTELTTGSKSSIESSTTDSTEDHTTHHLSSDTLSTDLSSDISSPVVLRQRIAHKVQKKDAILAKTVSTRLIEHGRHWSCEFLDHIPKDNESSSTSSSPTLLRRSASDPVPEKSPNKQRFISETEPAISQIDPKSPKQSCQEPQVDIEQEVMLTDDEVKSFASESIPLGGKRSSNGINLDSLDTIKILALEEKQDEEDELMAAASRGSRAQRTRTPRSSVEQARIKIVRLSNGDLDGSSPNHRYPLEDKENSNAVYRRHKNSSEVPPNFRHSMNFDDECMTPKGELSMSLTPDSIGMGMADNDMETELEPSNIEDPTVAITHERATLVNQRRHDYSRTKTLTQESAEEMSSMMDDDVPVKEDIEDYPAQTLTRDRAHRESDSDMSNFPLSRLDSLSEELQKALSQISSTPEMSMATLLDLEENIELNERLEKSESEHSSLEDLELDEAMISAYTIRNDDLFGSSTSIPSLFTGGESFSSACSSPPDNYNSPEHSFVPLRPSSSSRNRARNRMGNADLESIATAGSDDSCEASPSHLLRESVSPLPDDAGAQFSIDKLSDSSSSPRERRSSCVFQGVQLKRSTVVVHGEQLVIRKLVVAGIVSAEKTYMDCLTAMREYYRKPLLGRATTTQPILPERDINTIFYRTEDLCVLHSTLHDQLEPTLAKWSIKTCVGEFFVHLCRNLKLYKDYVEMYKKSVDCLTKHKTESPQFKTFIEDVHATVSAHFKDIPRVNELLRRPVERLQSYSLVLNDLCQHTPEDHPDYRILRESLQVMTAFIASTHDPQSFKHLSGGFNRELVKDGLVVELSDGIRKIRRVFLFHDVLVCSKQKPSRGGVKYEAKWYLPLNEISFKPPEDTVDSHRPVAVTSDVVLSVMKNKIAELKAQLSKTKEGGVVRDRTASTSEKDDKSFKRNLKAQILGQKSKHGDKYRKKLEEQEVAYWVASPSLPLRLYGRAGKQFMFVLHTEEERETWVSAIKKLQPKAVTGVYLSSYELQDLLGKQTSKDLRKIEDMIIPTIDEEYLIGVLRVRVRGASDLKAKPAGVYCCLELDEYGKFERKARTIPTSTDNPTLVTSWDQDFEIELTGAHILKVQICSKSLLKEETHATGKTRLPIKELKQSKRQRVEIKLVPQGSIEILLEYFSNISAMARKPSLLSSGVFGVPIEIVTQRERHDIPLIVQTCIDEIERRGMSEVGIYRVAGVLRDVQELRTAFDTDYLRAQMIAFEADIHAVAGLLKRYFRELPDPLFTNEFYTSFVMGLGLSDPEARAQCLLTLLHSLPPVNFKTAVFLFRHLRRVADNSLVNKMSLNNLSTVYGPNLLSPGGNEMQMDVVTPVSVVLFFLNCPAEYFDETLFGHSDLSTSTSSSNKSRNTGGRGSYTPASENRDSIGSSVTPLPLKRVPTDELDASLGSSPSRGINRRSRKGSNKLLMATKSETKTPISSRKESLV